jgi:hypothetical protein
MGHSRREKMRDGILILVPDYRPEKLGYHPQIIFLLWLIRVDDDLLTVTLKPLQEYTRLGTPLY